jgi:hypothetical protein
MSSVFSVCNILASSPLTTEPRALRSLLGSRKIGGSLRWLSAEMSARAFANCKEVRERGRAGLLKSGAGLNAYVGLSRAKALSGQGVRGDQRAAAHAGEVKRLRR